MVRDVQGDVVDCVADCYYVTKITLRMILAFYSYG